ncbi:IS630 transposase-related protein [Acetobacterium tundrae]|uniref:Transposase Synechocystis PCC 6803 domain-containing protein n=1 Tax=Acetobacterium tundrae TaxID=132932 RepID=A0ABR6WLJ0_9FIRM|nr:IS630 transposase-related protein [Acetobacterium tundrae]MBC3797156.1 hypothetical protein [Acetobacterium tundrae]
MIIILNKIKEDAITGLIAGNEITTVAKTVNVSRSTIYNWLSDKEFKDEMEARKKQIVEEGNAYITAYTLSHIEVIHKIAISNTDKRTALMAAQYLVDRSLGKMSNKVDADAERERDVIDVDILNEVLDEDEDFQ